MWSTYFKKIFNVLEAVQTGEWVAEKLGIIHNEAPHRPPGSSAALNRDNISAANAIIPSLNNTFSYANIANCFLVALHLETANHGEAQGYFIKAHRLSATYLNQATQSQKDADQDLTYNIALIADLAAKRIPPQYHIDPI